jgi:hypothetical protein
VEKSNVFLQFRSFGSEILTGFWRVGQKESNHQEDLDVDERMILKMLSEKSDEMILAHVTLYVDQWRALENKITELQCP